jgi:hypothetical protein
MSGGKTSKPCGPNSTPLPNSKSNIQHSKFPMSYTRQNRETDYAKVWAKLDDGM